MSRIPAASKEVELRLENIEVRLRTHAWVQDARLARPAPAPDDIGHSRQIAVQVVPSTEGIRTLRRQGKGFLVAELGRYLEPCGDADTPRIDWTLTEALTAQGPMAPTRVAGAAWMPIVTDIVLDKASRSLACRLLVPYDMPVFGGHFPNKPIVPGVVQVGWAVELARTQGLVQGRLTGISAAKFRRIVQPAMSLAASLTYDAQAGQLEFRYRLGGAAVTTGRVRFEARHD